VHRDNQAVKILDERLWEIGTDLMKLGLKDREGFTLFMKLDIQ